MIIKLIMLSIMIVKKPIINLKECLLKIYI